ncbi:SRPBCC family protein [Nonomuraea lactucae]|uniref:SRPBCC family protein n=1 Tax=Nonomuraea lactucae TaxID=2249762 RepID=UPI0019644CD8|nr:SRPBCC family protein [Nonomuraea lactucae]
MNNSGTMTVTAPTECEIVLTRVFDAPRRLVFDAWTKPELLRRWFGPHGYQLVVCDVDLRVGGTWRYVLCRPDGTEIHLHGVHREIAAPERLTRTEANDYCDAEAGEESLTTIVLVERDNRTTLTSTMRYPSKQIRDAMINFGAESGIAESYDRLTEVLAALVRTVAQ